MALVLDVITAIDERSAAAGARQLAHQFEGAGHEAGHSFGVNMLEGITAGFHSGEFESMLGVLSTGSLASRAATSGEALGVAFAGGLVAAAGAELLHLGVEVGETFEKINNQITYHTAATGEALEELKHHADALAGALGTSLDTLGSDMATLSTRLGMEAGPELDKLTAHVEQLGARFGALNPGNLGAAFRVFQVDGAQADDTLASLTHTSQQYAVELPGLVQNLAQFGTVFNELHLNMEQSAHMMAEVAAQGVPMQQAVMGMEAAAKAWNDPKVGQGRDFATFIRDAAESMEYYHRVGNETAADQIALDVFGQRRWAQAKVAADSYLETVRQSPEAFARSGQYIDDLAKQTTTLHGLWQRVKNQVDAALAPVAENVVEDLSGQMKEFVGWLSEHQQDLRSFFGHAIEAITPVVQGAGEVASFLGEYPGLIDATTVAFGVWASIRGVDFVLTGLEAIGAWLVGAPAEAEAAGAAIAASAETAGAAVATSAEAAGAAVTTSMTAADGAVVALNASLDTAAATLGAVAAGAAALAGPVAAVAAAVAGLYAVATATGSATGQESTTTPGVQYGPDGKVLSAGPRAPGAGGPPSPGGGPVPFFDAQGRPLDAQGHPFGAPGSPLNPTPYTPEMPKSFRPGTEAPGQPGTGGPGQNTPEGGAPGGLLTPDMFDPEKHARGPRLPAEPQVPFPAGYGAAPSPGESAERYSARQRVLEEQHAVEQARARLQQLEHTNNATQDDIQKARNELLTAERQQNEAQLQLQAEFMKGLRHHQGEMLEFGAKLDDDFGISKGLSGIAENITKFVGNLLMAPVLSALGTVVQATGANQGRGGGLIGMAANAGAFGPQYTPEYAQMMEALAGGHRGRGGRGGGGLGNLPAMMGGPGGGYAGDAALLANVPSGRYLQTQAADLTKGIGDCSSAVEDLINMMDGVSTAGRGMSTGNAAQWLTQHGFMPTNAPVPGAFNVGFNDHHMQATLPGGTPFNWGNDAAAANHGIGGTGASDPAFTEHFYRPVGPLAAGSAAGLGNGPGFAPSGYQPPAGPQQPAAGVPQYFDTGGGADPFNIAPMDTPGGGIPGAGDSILGYGGTNYGSDRMPKQGYHHFRIGTEGSLGPSGDRVPYVDRSHMVEPTAFFGAGGPRGTDTVPAWLTPREFVQPVDSVDFYGRDVMEGIRQRRIDPTSIRYLSGGGDDQDGPTHIGGREPNPGIGGGLSGGGAAAGAIGDMLGGAPASSGIGAGMSAVGGGLAAGAGAGAASMGIGLAAQIAMQEAQRAIQYAGQVGGIAMEGLMQTFLPTGASELAQNSWLTRIAGAVAGARPNLPNLAGKSQNAAPERHQDPGAALPGMPGFGMPAIPGMPGIGMPGAPTGPAPGPTPESVQPQAAPADSKGDITRGGKGEDAPWVHIEHYHAARNEDRAGQDIARHGVAMYSPANGAR